ncbi:unnamed protein product [Eruca vesicaria subsp. sativa]|uniref:Uncharacterized protein n=1 Tax=Eruca vesicaria subsp. sativa TaxID=29727 RepID=A0ABC8LWQ8_ERUVS|nr:unnamed protein product [Eruca vesicaria subsp. sativa]
MISPSRRQHQPESLSVESSSVSLVAASPLLSSKIPPESLLGLDPRSTANLFLDATCIRNKIINGEDFFYIKPGDNSSEDFFMLNLETIPAVREAQSCSILRSLITRCGVILANERDILIQDENSRLLSMRTKEGDVFWETSSELVMDDYQYALFEITLV